MKIRTTWDYFYEYLRWQILVIEATTATSPIMTVTVTATIISFSITTDTTATIAAVIIELN